MAVAAMRRRHNANGARIIPRAALVGFDLARTRSLYAKKANRITNSAATSQVAGCTLPGWPVMAFSTA